MANPNDLVLYLVLSPEFGGTRFGPFEGLEARLGSNRERCHITLPDSLGVSKEHCKVIRQGGTNMILAPSERTAAVYLWKGDARRPMQVQTPTAVRPGDSFSLVTPEGPRFFIELGELPPELKAQRAPSSKRGPKNLTAGKFAEAGKNLFLARLYTLSPISLGMRAMHYVQSGAIWQPRNLILGAIMLFGYGSAGLASCTAFKFKADAFGAGKKLEECNSNLAFADSMGDNVENSQFEELATKIVGDVTFGNALSKNDKLKEKVQTAARDLLADQASYAWLFDEQSKRPAEFAKWRERVEKEDKLDATSRRILPYLAAQPGGLIGDWGTVVDSGDVSVCGRGAARLTYRQARNLGMSNVQLDGYVVGDATEVVNDAGEATKVLARTAEAAGEPAPEGNVESDAEKLAQGRSTCVFAKGDDDRGDTSKVLNMLVEQVGTKAELVPDADSTFGVVARLLKLFAADVPQARFTDKRTAIVDFSKGNPFSLLAQVPHGDWVIDRAAQVIARAIVIPCDAALNGKKDKMEAVFGTLPKAIPCLVLNYRLTHEGT